MLEDVPAVLAAWFSFFVRGYWGRRVKFDAAGLDIYLAHRDKLVDYALPIVGCRLRAEDVVQEAYLRFTAALSRHEDALIDERAGPILQPVSYLYRIVRNLAVDLARHLSPETGTPSLEQLGEMAELAPSPEQTAVDRDRLRIVAAALDELPPRTRRAFELHRFDEMTFHDIAVELGISVGLAHRLVRVALHHCASRLNAGEH